MKNILILTMALIFGGGSYVIAEEESSAPVEAVADAESEAEEAIEEAPKYCPVCGPEEEMEELGFVYKHEGKKYRFCSLDCMKTFKGDPSKYIQSEGASETDEESHEGHNHKEGDAQDDHEGPNHE